MLELHSHKSNKSAVLQELRCTLELGSPVVKNHETKKRRHAELRQQLDAYCHAVNRPILNSGTNYIKALGNLLKLKKEVDGRELPKLDFDGLCHWDEDTFTTACSHVGELLAHFKTMGIPAQSPFAESTLDDISPIKQNKIITCLREALASLEKSRKLGRDLSERMGIDSPKTLAAMRAISSAGKRVLSAPP